MQRGPLDNSSLFRLKLAGVLLLIAIVVAATFSTVFASDDQVTVESGSGSFGQDAPVFPETRDVSGAYDPSRGQSATLDFTTPIEDESEHEDQAGFQAVYPPDERERITPTTSFPASAVAQIQMRKDGSAIGTCTGTFVGPDAVLTSAHCLYMPDTGWADQVVVTPGKDGSGEPFGRQFASNAWVPEAWISAQSAFWDWGVLKLPDSNLGQSVGWFEIGMLHTSTLSSSNFNPVIAGYPGDKTFGTQWMATEPSFTNVTNAHLYYMNDTYPGQSGAAIWRGNDSTVAGIHMGNVNDSNIGMRINSGLLDDIKNACATMGCQLSYFIEGESASPTPTPQPTSTPTPVPTASPDPTVTPTPAPTATATPVPDPPPVPDEPAEPAPVPDPPGQPGNVEPLGSDHFEHTWNRTDGPITDGHLRRTWMWGPSPFTKAISEPYVQSPDGERTVQYFDKTRMEITNPSADSSSIWYVTNGLLARELITGERQLGDDTSEHFSPAEIPVAGDGDDPDSPTYASFSAVMSVPAAGVGSTIIQRIERDGSVTDSSVLASYNVTAAYHVSETGHTVAAPFWEFMNSSGPVYENGVLTGSNLFENPFYATGFPLTEAYWATVNIDNKPRTVLIQVFERRVLTYAPDNPDGWQIEAGNVGIHYFLWRYVMEPGPELNR